MDDEFTFFDDGTMVFNSQGQVWAKITWVARRCGDAALTLLDAFGSGTHSFTATDTEITVNGLGAYFGWNKAYNQGELPSDASGTPQSTITYEVFDYTSNDGVDRLTITVTTAQTQVKLTDHAHDFRLRTRKNDKGNGRWSIPLFVVVTFVGGSP